MKIVAKPGRYAAAAVGVALAAAGLLAAGAPAIAAGQPHSAGHQASAREAWPGQDAPWQRAVSAGGLTGPTGPTGLAWPRNVPRPGSSSLLNGIYCPAARDCWAVGQYDQHGAELNQILRWNGRRWSQVTAPQPGGTHSGDNSVLFGVRCQSAARCWAVGDYEKSHAEFSEALRWNGKHWAKVTTPNPAGTGSGDFNTLIDVFCAAAKSCWAVGDDGVLGSGSETFLNLAVHWNGKHWAKVTTPNPGGTGADDANALDGIRCASARDCWAGGTSGTIALEPTLRNEALHWNGRHWSKATVPSPGGLTSGSFSEIDAVACLSGRDCWAIGDYGRFGTTSEKSLNQALHWNGKHWAKVTTPDPDGTRSGADNNLVAVTCFASANCWAVGEAGKGSSHVILNEAMKWNGHKWVLHKTPEPGGTASGDNNSLNAVRCTSGSFCWAVGSQQKLSGSELNQLLRWSGTKWAAG